MPRLCRLFSIDVKQDWQAHSVALKVLCWSRLKQDHGSLSSVLLYVAFFLPCSIHTAWLSYSVGLAALMVPKALDYTAHLEGMAALIAALITALGKPP